MNRLLVGGVGIVLVCMLIVIRSNETDIQYLTDTVMKCDNDIAQANLNIQSLDYQIYGLQGINGADPAIMETGIHQLQQHDLVSDSDCI